MRFGAIANSARGGPQRPPPMGDRVKDSETPAWLGLKYVLLVIILHVIREGQALICGWERGLLSRRKD